MVVLTRSTDAFLKALMALQMMFVISTGSSDSGTGRIVSTDCFPRAAAAVAAAARARRRPRPMTRRLRLRAPGVPDCDPPCLAPTTDAPRGNRGMSLKDRGWRQ